jgi:drug/metabolite transporter (DMT)-like permease
MLRAIPTEGTPMSHPVALHAAALDRRRAVGWLAALATVAIWAVWMIGTRHAVTHTLDPAAIGILRFGLPALALAPVWWRLGLKPKGLRWPLLLALMGAGAPFFLVVATGMRFAPAAEIGPLLPGTMPLFVALLGWALFGERFGRLRGIGYALIVLGIVAIGGHGLLALDGGAWRGHLLLLAGALLWAVYTHAYRRSGLSPVEAAALIAGWSVLLLLPAGGPALMRGIGQGLAADVLIQAFLQGGLSGLAAMLLNGLAIDRLGASRAAAVSPLGPVLATLLAVPLLGEVPGAVALVGLVSAAAGVALASGMFGVPRPTS